MLAVRSNVFLCVESWPCSPLSFEKGSTFLCCKVLQNVCLATVSGGEVSVEVRFCYQAIGGVVEDELVLI